MAAFFFPNKAPLSPGDKQGIYWNWQTRHYEYVYWHRQAVDPLDLAALLKDSRAKAALTGTYSLSWLPPERYFSNYAREDGSGFIVGTIEPSKFTLPYRSSMFHKE